MTTLASIQGMNELKSEISLHWNKYMHYATQYKHEKL